MVALTDLTLTGLWHDADLERVQFVWDADGEVTGMYSTVLNPEEDIGSLAAFGLTSRQVTIYFRNVGDVQTILHSNYSAMPTIDDWAVNTSSTNGIQQHTITTVSGCRFRLECQSVWLQPSGNP
ncbi:hypothetical protein [Kouleothrix sp.]|uniref:hypothetical protein n=1 Tax=Kouleothrix sp. TaxID=2779161 RepID=UPI0039193E00